MTANAYCSGCAGALRADDRFCTRCGDTANAGEPTSAHLQEFRPKNGPLHRIGDFAVNHAKGLLALLAIATLAGFGFLFGQETSVPETASSPGYEMVRELKSNGAIDSFTAIEPEDGWETEYSMNDGDAHVRFRGTEMEYDVTSYDDDLRDAIESEASREGFTG